MKKLAILCTFLINASLNAVHPDILQKWISEGDLVFEVGAYVGEQTEQCRKLGAHVICIEPQHVIYLILQKRFAEDPQVTLVPKGIAHGNGILQMYMCHNLKPLSTFSAEWVEKSRYAKRFDAQWEYTTPVEVVTLDAVINQFGIPKLCLLDIENYEYEALRGLSHHIPIIAFEFHAETIHKTELCIERLEQLGYTEFNLSIANDNHLDLSEWCSGALLAAYLDSLIRTNPNICGELYAK